MRKFIRQLWNDDSGQDATEYALLVVLISLAIAVGARQLGDGVDTAFRNAGAEMGDQASGS